MKISYNWLQNYFEVKLPEADKLAELFTTHVFEVESVEKKGDNSVLDCKVLPDRAHYLLCHKGVAREIKAILGLEMKVWPMTPPAEDKDLALSVKVKESALCKRYMAREIRNISVPASPAWLKDSLEAVGQKSINSIVDAGNMVMLDIGQPLHIFDSDKVKGGIVVRKAKAGEKITILTGAEIALNETDLVIADDEGPIAIAGVKGGKRAEVTANTNRIIIESANFNPTSVRRTSTRLNLRNESSKRFENELTPALAAEGIEKITHLVESLSPNAVFGVITDIYPEPVKAWGVEVSPKYIAELVGSPVSNSEIEKILSRMGCAVSKQGDMLSVTPPLDRLDLVIPEDIADEIGRILGYDRLLSAPMPAQADKFSPNKTFYYAEKAKNAFVEAGYSEVLLYSLVPMGAFQIAYPLASDKTALRESLSPKLKESLIFNGRNADLLSLETIKIFEIGKVFPADGEKTSLCVGVMPLKKKKGVTAESLLQADIEKIGEALGISINPKIEKGDFGAVCEIEFDILVSQLPEPGNITYLGFVALPENLKYKKFSQYPFVSRDIAVFVPESVSQEEVHKMIKDNCGPLCIKDYLFDVFTKDNKTSFAFRLIFQSFERTLEDSDVNVVMDKIYKEMSSKEGWQIR